MQIENALVFTEMAQFSKRNITIGGQYIIDGTPSEERLDATDYYAIPGLMDTHFHGDQGIDISSLTSGQLGTLCRQQAATGVTAICPTVVTSENQQVDALCEQVAQFEPEGDQAAILGIHLEGPYLSPEKAGSHNPGLLALPDPKQIQRWIDLSEEGIAILTLAPELAGAIQLIQQFSKELSVSVGHSVASYTQAVQAFTAGANRLTHLYNTMAPLSHKEPGLIGAAFDDENVMAELICDGTHVHPSAVRAAFSLFGEDRIVMVSDCTAGSGGDRSYTLGKEPFTVTDGVARLADGRLAGGTKNLYQNLVTAVKEMGIPLEVAVRAATMNAAQSLDLFDRYGSITPGKIADILLIDEDLKIHQIILRGVPLLPFSF